MEAEREQSWKIRVTSKARSFNFRFRFAAATNASTRTLSFFRFSILLNLRQFNLRITSHPKKATFITTKVLKFFHKFRPRFPRIQRPNISAKTKTTSNVSYAKVRGATLLSCVAQSVVFSAASLLLKKFNMVKLLNLTAFVLVGAATMVCYLFFYFDYNYNYYLEYMGRFAWNKIGNL